MDNRAIENLSGRVIAGYRIARELGRGGNGVVYLANQRVFDRPVALKFLFPELAADPGYVGNFFREARLAARMNHPNIVQAIDVGSGDGLYYFAMEYVPGPTLEEIRRNAPEKLSLPFILRISIELAAALDYAALTHGISHGDIKPGNLLIRHPDGVLKLADLGLGRAGDARSGETMATPLYAAPEIIDGSGAVGVPGDIYSFGVMFYELTAGTAPFNGDTDAVLKAHLESDPAPLIELNADIPRRLSDFTGRMLARSPAARPPDWKSVGAFMKEMLDDHERRSRPAGFLPKAHSPRFSSNAAAGRGRLLRRAVWITGAIMALVFLYALWRVIAV